MSYYTIYTFYDGEYRSHFHGDIEYIKGIFDYMVFSEEFDNEALHVLAIKSYAGETTLISPEFMISPLGSWNEFNMSLEYYLYTSQLSLLSVINNTEIITELSTDLCRRLIEDINDYEFAFDPNRPPNLSHSITTDNIIGNYKLLMSSRRSKNTITGSKSYIDGVVSYLKMSDLNERDVFLLATSDHNGIIIEIPDRSLDDLSWLLSNYGTVLNDMYKQAGYTIDKKLFDYVIAMCKYMIESNNDVINIKDELDDDFLIKFVVIHQVLKYKDDIKYIKESIISSERKNYSDIIPFLELKVDEYYERIPFKEDVQGSTTDARWKIICDNISNRSTRELKGIVNLLGRDRFKQFVNNKGIEYSDIFSKKRYPKSIYCEFIKETLDDFIKNGRIIGSNFDHQHEKYKIQNDESLVSHNPVKDSYAVYLYKDPKDFIWAFTYSDYEWFRHSNSDKHPLTGKFITSIKELLNFFKDASYNGILISVYEDILGIF